MSIKVLIVDDSNFFRRRISEIIASDPGMEVVGTVSNGKDAVAMVSSLKPDVVTMDVEMPIMDGINAVKGIMSACPTPIIMFSSLTQESADITFNALEAGALDFITKNFDDIARDKEEARKFILSKIRDISRKHNQVVSIAISKYNYGKTSTGVAQTSKKERTAFENRNGTESKSYRSGLDSSRIFQRPVTEPHRYTSSNKTVGFQTNSTRTLLRSDSAVYSPKIAKPVSHVYEKVFKNEPDPKIAVPLNVKELTAATFEPSGKKYSLVAIGASTGGPIAIQSVISRIPADFPVPILVVQHMPATFTTSFAARLDKMSKISVREAHHGDQLVPGVAYIAPGAKQMYIDTRKSHNYAIKVTESDPSINFRPCIDLTFVSVNNAYKGKVLAVILTGMGADGCAGCRLLKQSGATVWAQNEETCVIYGMPQAVVNDSIASITLPIQDIGECIVREVMSR